MAEDEACLMVDVYYNGILCPKPSVYFDPDIAKIRNIDFIEMSYMDFLLLIKKLTKSVSKDIHFCLLEAQVNEGLHALQNECDFNEFLEAANGFQKRVNVYVDHFRKPLFE